VESGCGGADAGERPTGGGEVKKLLCAGSIFCVAVALLAGGSTKPNDLEAAHAEGLKNGFLCGRAAGIWLTFDAQHNSEGKASAEKIFINGGCLVLMKDSGVNDELLKSLEHK
jgi:hypothetical protein